MDGSEDFSGSGGREGVDRMGRGRGGLGSREERGEGKMRGVGMLVVAERGFSLV